MLKRLSHNKGIELLGIYFFYKYDKSKGILVTYMMNLACSSKH